MGHQVNFYAAPADVAEIEARIRDLEPLTILHSRSTAVPRSVPSLDFQEAGQQWLFFYLVRERDLPEVVMRPVANQEYSTIDVLRSPVVEFNSCYFDSKVLRRGRVYYVDGFYGADDAWIDKPESFRRWAKALLKATKTALSKHGSDYIGHEASVWLTEHQGTLAT